MTIQPNRDSFTVHCDTCTAYLEVDAIDFNDVIKTMVFKGWKTVNKQICNKSGKVSHECPACQEGKNANT